MLHCRTSESMDEGWRDDYIDLMAGVAQIADNLTERTKSAAMGQEATSHPLRTGSRALLPSAQ
jgi:hypothetical protein